MKIDAKMSISRCSDGKIKIDIEDRASLATFFRGSMGLEDFANVITGFASQKIEAEVGGLQNVGKKRVREDRKIICPLDIYDRNAIAQWLRDNAQEAGWILDDYLEAQGSIVRNQDGTQTLRYSVYKFVEQNNG